jgi:glutaredoxin
MPASAGQIYKWVDENGRVHIGDRPPSSVDAQPLELRINTYRNEAPDLSVFQGRDVSKGFEKVVIYTTQRCGYCRKAKAWFRQKGITYSERDIDTSSRARKEFDRLGARGVPVILVGKERINGYNEPRLRAALKRGGYKL